MNIIEFCFISFLSRLVDLIQNTIQLLVLNVQCLVHVLSIYTYTLYLKTFRFNKSNGAKSLDLCFKRDKKRERDLNCVNFTVDTKLASSDQQLVLFCLFWFFFFCTCFLFNPTRNLALYQIYRQFDYRRGFFSWLRSKIAFIFR